MPDSSEIERIPRCAYPRILAWAKRFYSSSSPVDDLKGWVCFVYHGKGESTIEDLEQGHVDTFAPSSEDAMHLVLLDMPWLVRNESPLGDSTP